MSDNGAALPWTRSMSRALARMRATEARRNDRHFDAELVARIELAQQYLRKRHKRKK